MNRRTLWGIMLALVMVLAGCVSPPTTDGDQPLVEGPTETAPMPGGIRTPEDGSEADENGDTGSAEPPPTAVSTSPPQENDGDEGTSANNWAVYFTDPVIPFNDVTTGGIEENIVWLISNAEETIDAAMFELDLQNVADALIQAHQRGVRVRVVHDNEHTEEDPQIDQLKAAGIPVRGDERSALMHNKFFVFDGDIVWTGSLNITVNGAYRNNNNAVALISPAVGANYTTEFEEMFGGEFGPTSPANTPYPGTQVGDMWVETYFSPEDDALQQLISIVSEAEESIHFMAFSYTDYDLAKAMMDRAAVGVEVAGIFESRGANTQYSECPTLLNYGLDVRLDDNPRTFHHKVIIIDGRMVATGSFNYSTNATTSNDENILILHNPQIAALYEQEFSRQMASANLPSGGECLAGD